MKYHIYLHDLVPESILKKGLCSDNHALIALVLIKRPIDFPVIFYVPGKNIEIYDYNHNGLFNKPTKKNITNAKSIRKFIHPQISYSQLAEDRYKELYPQSPVQDGKFILQ